MSMDDNDRNEVIKLQAERAQNIIKEIDILIENRLWATTANYNCMIQITEDEVKSLVEPTKELVGKLLLLAAS